MGTNGTDDDASASDATLTLDAPGRAPGGEAPVGDAPQTEPEVPRPPLLRVVSHPRGRIGRPTRLTPRLAKALVKLIAQTGRIEPAARRCGIPRAR
jgi:hypothetical protein